MAKKDDGLFKKLNEYSDSDMYPFHMPGHKRRDPSGGSDTILPYKIDITEIDGFDNLHHAEGILKDEMDLASKVYGSDRTYFLVNGSTCGILAAICASAKPGSSILMARNSHISAYNALILGDLDPVYILPSAVPVSGFSSDLPMRDIQGTMIFGSIDPSDIETALEKDSDRKIRAVFIVSPTYEGIVSDISFIADIAHSYGIPLIVDEAHGAHLNFAPDDGYFPGSALECGADIVIQSLHKTLPALTQTAVLHVKGDLADKGRLDRFLSMFETSSPSYILMASIDECIRYMDCEGREEMKRYETRLKNFYAKTLSLKTLKIFDPPADNSGSSPETLKDRRLGIFARDPSKIVISTCGAPDLSGPELAQRLREDYHIETEMSAPDYVIAMTSLMDTDEGYARLISALEEIDRSL